MFVHFILKLPNSTCTNCFIRMEDCGNGVGVQVPPLPNLRPPFMLRGHMLGEHAHCYELQLSPFSPLRPLMKGSIYAHDAQLQKCQQFKTGNGIRMWLDFQLFCWTLDMHQMTFTQSQSTATTLVRMSVMRRKRLHAVTSHDRTELSTTQSATCQYIYHSPHHVSKWSIVEIWISYVRRDVMFFVVSKLSCRRCTQKATKPAPAPQPSVIALRFVCLMNLGHITQHVLKSLDPATMLPWTIGWIYAGQCCTRPPAGYL